MFRVLNEILFFLRKFKYGISFDYLNDLKVYIYDTYNKHKYSNVILLWVELYLFGENIEKLNVS